jgi:TM2 domain-containing membrane protein YozV
MPSKNPMTALLLSLIPGLGHLYLNRGVRAFFYGAGFFGPLLIVFLMLIRRSHDGGVIMFLLVVAALVGMINMLDMVIRLVKGKERAVTVTGEVTDEQGTLIPLKNDNERLFTILMSFIPGLGHLQLGMMQRGLAFLTTFFGALVMIVFVSILTNTGGFLAFLGVLPIIWLYCIFDCIQQLTKKERGEALLDKTFLEDFQESRADGKKSKMIATFLSIVPGAGHMYLGLQKRGLQLMGAFFLCIYMMDVLRLSFFLFIIPILWFYSFFDALQQISKQGQEELKDAPFVDWFLNHQKWVGIVLLGLGLYYLTNEMLLNLLDNIFPKERISYLFNRYFQSIIVSVLLIGGGLRLLAGSKRRKG